eukprot:m.339773 g.339773  ORF g.339773 m.339773 type:complete len:408 (+) comp18959_c0_seq1:144-1367(+)
MILRLIYLNCLLYVMIHQAGGKPLQSEIGQVGYFPWNKVTRVGQSFRISKPLPLPKDCDKLPVIPNYENLLEEHEDAIDQDDDDGFKDAEVCSPVVYITGCKKCGTNTIMQILLSHQNVKYSGRSRVGKLLMKHIGMTFTEESFFLDCGAYPLSGYNEWCKRLYHFDTDVHNKGLVPPLSRHSTKTFSHLFDHTDWKHSFAVDKSPLALFAPLAISRLQQVAPNAKMLVTLCNPVARALSAINHENKVWIRHNPKERVQERTQKIMDMVKEIGNLFDMNYNGLSACANSRDYGEKTMGMSISDVCREILLPGYWDVPLTNFAEKFRPDQIIVVDAEWALANQNDARKSLFNALGTPELDKVNIETIHANKGTDENVAYQDSFPEEFVEHLQKIYEKQIALLKSGFHS